MYAVIRVGGKQERVAPGDVIEVEFMKVDPGSEVEFDPVVVFDDDGKAHVGKDLGKARVVARLLGDKKGEKVRVFKYRPKSGYRRTMGHRQVLTLLEIQEVGLSSQKKTTKAEAAEKPAKKPAAKKPVAKAAPAKKTVTAKKTTTRKSTAKKSTTRKKST